MVRPSHNKNSETQFVTNQSSSRRRGRVTAGFVSLLLILSLFIIPLPVSAAAAAPSLGAASEYGILGATTTVTEQTNITGSLGSGGSTGTAVVSGSTDIANSAYTAAVLDFGTAMTFANSLPADSTGAASDLGGLTITPGVYKFTGAVTIGSNVILSGNGVYIFQIDGAFTTAANTIVQLTEGAQACNIFWVANVATIGAESILEGSVLSTSAVTIGSDSTINGRILAQSEVTANASNTTINVPAACAALVEPTPEPVIVPEPIPEPTPEPVIVPEPKPEPTPEPVIVPEPVEAVAACPSPIISTSLNKENQLVIDAKLPNEAKGTGTWHFDLGGQKFQIKGNEAITYTAENAPVGTYQVQTQFISDDQGTNIQFESCTVSVPTVTGGELPDTATPWYNLLFAGTVVLLLAIAAAIWNRRKLYE